MNDFFDSSILFNAVDANRRKRKTKKKAKKKYTKIKNKYEFTMKAASKSH